MGQPGGEGTPPLQLLLVLAQRFWFRFLIGGAQAAPQGLTQGPDLGPVSQDGCGEQRMIFISEVKADSALHQVGSKTHALRRPAAPSAP